MSKRSYTTNGAVRGSCGHKHRTIEAAVKCMLKDDAGCRKQGGYGDRVVVLHDSADCYGDFQQLDSGEIVQAQIAERRLSDV